MVNGKLQEFRLVHPESRYDLTFAIELKGQTLFPIQDFRGNICALQRKDGTLAQWTRYSAFGEKTITGDLGGLFNPWRFANRREIADLSLFTHRFYHPQLMRWLTTDPLGFKDGLNLYAYVHNNPFCYKDPDGQLAIAIMPVVIPIFEVAFGAVVTTTLLPAIGVTLASAAVMYGCYELAMYANNQINQRDTDNVLEEDLEEHKSPQVKGKKRPPYCGQALGSNSTKCPGEGFEWKGKGNPESGRGAWHNQNTNESLHPDFNHPPPKAPQWDYEGPEGDARLNLDGTWEWK